MHRQGDEGVAQAVVEVAGHALALAQKDEFALLLVGAGQLLVGGAQFVDQTGALLAGAEDVVDVEVEQQRERCLGADGQGCGPVHDSGQLPAVGAENDNRQNGDDAGHDEHGRHDGEHLAKQHADNVDKYGVEPGGQPQ